MKNPVILSACRTAGGKFGGTISSLEATDLGAIAIKEAVKRAGVSAETIDEVIMGNGWQAGVGSNPARVATIKAGLPVNIPAFTVNMRCGSGLQTIMLASDKIRTGDNKVTIAGGMESASNVPYLLKDARWGHRMGDKTVQDVLHKDGFMCPLAEMLMGFTAEILAEEYSISREDQDRYALESHQKAISAIETGKFEEEIIPVQVKQGKNEIMFQTDEIAKKDTTLDKLAKLPTIFKKNGTVTAGTSSALCDASSSLVLADNQWAKDNDLTPIGEIIGYASAGCDPKYMGMGPIYAIPKALAKAGVTLKDIDLIELNEAFAAQVLAVNKALPFDLDKCNVHGGAISLGHPIGASGCRILVTLLHAMQKRDAKLGLATLCIGGGQGVAAIVEKV